jgi:hypothetical protein
MQAVGMALLGAGIGSTVQVTMLAAQNSVPSGDLGVATSTVTFFRSMGATVGVAVFGALFSARLAEGLGARSAVRLPDDVGGLTPGEIAALDPPARHLLVSTFADSLGLVFRWAVPVVALAVIVALCLREVPLRVRASRAPITE